MGGMAAQIPLKDPAENEKAMEKVRADKEREVAAGHDGTWVAHPGLVPIAREIFEEELRKKGYENNQLQYKRQDVHVTEENLLEVPKGTLTYDHGLKNNIKIGIQYLESWLRGVGCVPLGGKMEDAATAEISRAQDWQWLHHNAKLDDGRIVTKNVYCEALHEVREELMAEVGAEKYHAESKYPEAVTLFSEMVENGRFEPFLTMPAYEQVLRQGDGKGGR